MKSKSLLLASVALIALLAVSCKSTRKAATGRGTQNLELMQRVEEVLKQEVLPQSYSAKVDVTLQSGSTNVNSKGDLRIVPGQAIYLSLQPFLGIELFRVVITPEKLLIIDRTKKRYITQSLSSVALLGQEAHPYDFIQALFLNRLFIVGNQAPKASDFERFTLTSQENNGLLMEQSILDKASYSFTIDRGNLLTTTSLALPGSNFRVDWQYSGFVSEGAYTQPTLSHIEAKLGDKRLTVKIASPKIEFDKKLTIDQALPNKYDEVKLDELLKSLLK